MKTTLQNSHFNANETLPKFTIKEHDYQCDQIITKIAYITQKYVCFGDVRIPAR